MEEKETILVSACLLGVNCKYDGSNNEQKNLLSYLEGKEVIPICPEQLGGLKTPRESAERKGHKVLTKSGTDVTLEYQKGAEETLHLARLFGAKKAILKSKSPSCGVGQIYDGSYTHTLVDGDGVTAELLKKEGIEVISSEEISS